LNLCEILIRFNRRTDSTEAVNKRRVKLNEHAQIISLLITI